MREGCLIERNIGICVASDRLVTRSTAPEEKLCSRAAESADGSLAKGILLMYVPPLTSERPVRLTAEEGRVAQR